MAAAARSLQAAWAWRDALWPCYSCCRQIWIPSQGQFSPQCLGVIGHIPLWVALLTLVLRYGVGPLWAARRPVWLRRFAAEENYPNAGAGSDQESGTSAARGKAWTPWTVALLALSLAAAVLGVVGAVLRPEHAQFCLTVVLPSIASCVILAVGRPRTAPGPVLLITTVLVLMEVAVLVLMPSAVPHGWPRYLAWTAGVCLPLASITLILNMPLRDPRLDSTGIGKPFAEPSNAVRSPEDVITLWQWMSVSWMAPLIRLGYKRQLHDADVWFLAYEFQHSRLHMLFRELSGSVLARLLKANGLDLLITTGLGVLETALELAEPVLLKQLLVGLTAAEPQIRTAVVYAGITLFARLVRTQSGVFSLWFCRRTYERARGEMITMIHEKTLRRKAFTFPSGQELPRVTADDQPQEGHQQDPPTPTPGISTSTTLTDDDASDTQNNDDADADSSSESNSSSSNLQKLKSLLHRGYAKLNPPKPSSSVPPSPSPTPSPPPPQPQPEQEPPTSPASTGKILNLLRSDAYEVAQRFWEFPGLTTKPLGLLLSLLLLWRVLGLAALAGVSVLLAGMLANVFLLRLLARAERARREASDVKLARTAQFVESARHLRWYAWEGKWLGGIMERRGVELGLRVRSNVVLKGIGTVNALAAYLFPVVGFWAYTIVAGRELTVDVAFPALDLFGMVQNSLRELPDLVAVLLNARVAMGRIEKFMQEEEKEGELDVLSGNAGPPGELEIVLEDASFAWPGSAGVKRVLRDVSVVCRPGLTVVCGRVGIGKTALLQAVLGELDQHGGERSVPHEMVGYCAQAPWLESMSIRENILFSAAYDKVRFEQVIDACCLRDDLDKFRCKDLTLIGENGVGLSGGQRARVALARAIYSRARILLLDDPIAALDHQTATSIVQNLFADKSPYASLAAGRLVIFVTHRVDIVTPYAYQVVEIVDGGRVQTFDRQELESNEEELEHLAEIAAAQPGVEGEEDATQGDEEPVPDKFIEDEHRVHGGVMASVYWQYVKAGRLRWWSTMIGFFVLFRIARIAYFWFLKEWGEQYSSTPEGLHRAAFAGFGEDAGDFRFTVASQNVLSRRAEASGDKGWFDLGRYLPPPRSDVHPWINFFLVLSLAQVLTHSLSDATLVVIIYKAGKNLFEKCMQRVAYATFRFYDVTPVGRLMNRLTSDMGTVDGQIAGQLMQVAWFALGWLSSIVVISTATPSFLVISVAMTALFVFVFDRFLPTSQSLRRLETVSLSPLMSNFGTLVEGLTTVRAFRAEPHFQNRIIASTDAFQKMDHIYWSLQAWLQYRFDVLSALSTFALTLTAVLSGLSSGTVGFVLAAASNFVQATHALCRRYGEMQMQFVSVERVIELLGLEQEPRGAVRPPAAWPLLGDAIIFDRVTLRYAPGLDPVLTDVSLTIPGGANVAVTGRTGSGKSTLALSLLGTLHPDAGTGGSIRIGSVDLATVDKQALRRNITFVAQDPVLFPGTLRDNLDPLDEHAEAERAAVLARVLGNNNNGGGDSSAEEEEANRDNSSNNNNDFTLDTPIDAGGKNLSQGQRQLVGLGRAMLRRSPVVILDEATASIDAATAAYIQRLLRVELAHSTVITIAHKAEAVQDADWEVVLDRGRVVRAGPRGARLEREREREREQAVRAGRS